VAACFARLPGVRVVPDPPVTNLFHVHWPVPSEALLDASAALARERRIALVTRTRPCDVAGHSIRELTIGDAASAIPPGELEPCLTELLLRARENTARSRGWV